MYLRDLPQNLIAINATRKLCFTIGLHWHGSSSSLLGKIELGKDSLPLAGNDPLRRYDFDDCGYKTIIRPQTVRVTIATEVPNITCLDGDRFSQRKPTAN